MIPYIILTIYLTLNVYFFGMYIWSYPRDIKNKWHLLGMSCLFIVVGSILFLTGYITSVLEKYLYDSRKRRQ